jgi:hypothetical protein
MTSSGWRAREKRLEKRSGVAKWCAGVWREEEKREEAAEEEREEWWWGG